MKTIGLIGGISWLSTQDYYRILNEMVNERLGGVASAKIILYSVDYAEIKSLTDADRWDDIENKIRDIASKLEKAGAECLLIGANTMHKIAEGVREAIDIPVIHIAEETARTIKQQKLATVALLGTKYTMQLDFYKNKLAAQGIATMIPGEEEIQYINNAIYSEMGKGLFLPETKAEFLRIMNRLIESGAEGIILGCTELPILIKQEDCRVPVFDTTRIHSTAAVVFALG